MIAHAQLSAGLMPAASVSLCAQRPIPPGPPVTNLTIEATQNKVDAALRVVVVTTVDGVEHLIHFTKDLLVHGGKGSGVDALQGLEAGRTVVVHYTRTGSDETAQEIDVIGGDQGLKTAEGVLTDIDRQRQQITIRFANGTTETLQLTQQAAADAGKDLDSASNDGTAQRSGEVCRMRWEDVDLDGAWWTIPAHDSKNGDPHRVPLTAEAVSALKRRRANADDRFVFSNHRHTCVAARAKKAAAVLSPGLSFSFRAHDLRRTAASFMGEAGVDRFHIAHVLNHRSVTHSTVTAIYDRYRCDKEKRAALERWALLLEGIAARPVREEAVQPTSQTTVPSVPRFESLGKNGRQGASAPAA
jgi:hypothetical protein